MLQVSSRHGMPLAMASEATRPIVVYQTSHRLWYFPCQCLRISTRPNSLLLFLYTSTTIALKARWASIKRAFTTSSILSAAISLWWLQHLCLFCQPSGTKTVPPEHKQCGCKGDHSAANSQHYGHFQLGSLGEHMLVSGRGGDLCWGLCRIAKLALVLGAQGKCMLKITKLEC